MCAVCKYLHFMCIQVYTCIQAHVQNEVLVYIHLDVCLCVNMYVYLFVCFVLMYMCAFALLMCAQCNNYNKKKSTHT